MTLDITGRVLRPGDDGFDDARTGYQLALPHRPDLVVAAAGTADVVAAVRHAAAHGLPVAVQATGHGRAAPIEGGVLIHTGAMNEVEVDPASRTAWVGAGTRWEKVVAAAARHGLAPPSGSSPHVGAVGYTLGGGLGLLARRRGYAADHVREFELVTADARVHRLTPGAELFRALLGGGGNFGVVTGMRIGLLPITRVYGGGLYFPASARVLAAWRDWTADVPDELTSTVGMVPMPDLPMVPEPLRGRHVVHIRVVFEGDAETGERLVAPLRAAGPVLLDTLGVLPYTETGTISGDPPFAHAYTGRSAMLADLGPGDVDTVYELAGPDAAVPCVVQVRHLGGALARPSAAVIGHRDARYALHVLSALDDADTGKIADVHRGLIEALYPMGTFLNFHYGPATDEQVRAAFAPDVYADLVRLKARHDPGGMFHASFTIPSAV